MHDGRALVAALLERRLTLAEAAVILSVDEAALLPGAEAGRITFRRALGLAIACHRRASYAGRGLRHNAGPRRIHPAPDPAPAPARAAQEAFRRAIAAAIGTAAARVAVLPVSSPIDARPRDRAAAALARAAGSFGGRAA